VYPRAMKAPMYQHGSRCISITTKAESLSSKTWVMLQFTQLSVHVLSSLPDATTIFCIPLSWAGSFHPTSSSGNSRFTLVFLCNNFGQLLLLAQFFLVTTTMTSDGVQQTFPQARCFLRSCSISCDGGDAAVLQTTPAQNHKSGLEMPEEVT